MAQPKVQHKIYALLDQRDSPPSVRYVGCTSSGVDTRFSLHISEALNLKSTRPKDEWIRSMLLEGLEPMLLVLERLPYGSDWEIREKHWIGVYSGPLLNNVSSGGGGSPGARRSERMKEKVGDFFRGKSLNEEHRSKLSAAKMGHEVSPETRARISEKLVGRTQSPESVAKRALAMTGRHHTEEAREKISSTRKRLIAQGLIKMPNERGANAASKAITGSVWINDGQVSKRVPKDAPIPEGWKPGRALSESQLKYYESLRKK